ncbi:MAG: protease modulator HflC [bacterium]
MEKKIRQKVFIFLSSVLVLILIFLSLFIVDETEHKIVTFFGRPTRVVSEPGLHFKSPLHTTINLDKRLLLYNPNPREYLTRDKKNMVVDTFICWKVIDPLDFYVTVNNISKAEDYLDDLMTSQVSAILGEYNLSSLVSIKPGEMKINDISHKVEESCRQRARMDYSIEIASIELKQLILPQQNKQSVFDRMRAERERTAKQYRAEGQEEAMKIRAAADRECKLILSESFRKAEVIRGEGDAEAIQIYGDAYSQDLGFYKEIRTLEAYPKILNEKTTVVLSSDSDFLKLLTEGHTESRAQAVKLELKPTDKKDKIVKR